MSDPTNLTQKLTTIETQLTDQQTALLAALADQLAATNTAAGYLNNTGAPYLATVAEALASGNDINSQMRDSFNDIKENLRTAAAATAEVFYPPVLNGYNTIQQAAIAEVGFVEAISYDSTAIRALWGENTIGDATGTLMAMVREINNRLDALQASFTAAQPIGPPDVINVPSLLVSTGQVYVPSGDASLGDAMNVATWLPPPDPLGVYGLGNQGVAYAHWEQALVYVESGAETFSAELSFERFNTNRWMPMPGDPNNTGRTFAVKAPFRCIVYILLEPAPPEENAPRNYSSFRGILSPGGRNGGAELPGSGNFTITITQNVGGGSSPIRLFSQDPTNSGSWFNTAYRVGSVGPNVGDSWSGNYNNLWLLTNSGTSNYFRFTVQCDGWDGQT
jgi:hypothetical protein